MDEKEEDDPLSKEDRRRREKGGPGLYPELKKRIGDAITCNGRGSKKG